MPPEATYQEKPLNTTGYGMDLLSRDGLGGFLRLEEGLQCLQEILQEGDEHGRGDVAARKERGLRNAS